MPFPFAYCAGPCRTDQPLWALGCLLSQPTQNNGRRCTFLGGLFRDGQDWDLLTHRRETLRMRSVNLGDCGACEDGSYPVTDTRHQRHA